MSRVKLADTITDLLNEMDKSVHDYNRLETIALSGLRLLNLDVYGNIKTKAIKVELNGKAHFPKDCINYIKIGVITDLGELATFSRNNDLALNRGCTDTKLTTAHSAFNYENYDISNQTRTVYFGAGSDVNIGEFRVDKEENAVLFGPGIQYKEITIEYLSNQIDDDGVYYVDDRLEEALKSFTYWTAIKRLKSYTAYDKRDAKSEWLIEKRKAKSRVNPFRIIEANDSSRQSLKLALKH